MSDSNRLRNYAIGLGLGALVAAAVGYLWLWQPATALQEQISLESSKAAEQYQDGAYIAVECEAAIVTEASEPQCLEAEAEAAKEAERNHRDLEAQQTMAVWTQAMGKAAVIGTGVGIVGLFLIFVTFWETRNAAREGARANTIALTHLNLATEERIPTVILDHAFLCGEQVGTVAKGVEGVPPKASYASITYRSTGESVLKNAKLKFGYGVFEKPPEHPEFSNFAETYVGRAAIVEQRWHANRIKIEISDPDIARMESGDAHLWLWCNATFEDFLGGAIEIGNLLRWSFNEPMVGNPSPDNFISRWMEQHDYPEYSYNCRTKPIQNSVSH